MIAHIKEATRSFVAGLLMLPAALFAVAIAPDIGEWEGTFAPVVDKYKIVENLPTSDGMFDVVVSFDKNRNCKFVNQTWAINVYGNVYRKYAQAFPEDGTGKPISRGKGEWVARWHVFAPFALSTKPVRLTVHHYCWGPLLWQTETVVNLVEEAHAE